MDDQQPAVPPNFPLIAAIFEGGLAIVAVGLGWLLDRPPLRTFWFSWAGALWGLVATLPLLGLLWLMLKCPWRPFVRTLRIVEEHFVPLLRQCSVAEMAVIALLAGVGEEALVRGIVQSALGDWLGDWLGGPWGAAIALVAAAVLFGLAHAITPVYTLMAGLIGLYLGAAWLLVGNLLVPITTHAAYDFCALVYLTRMRTKVPDAA